MEQVTSRNADRATGATRTLPLAVLAAFVWLLMLLAGLGELDPSIIVNSHVGDGPWLAPVIFLTRLGDWEILLALPFLAAGWLMLRGSGWRLPALLLGSAIGGRLLVDIQKIALQRVRPDEFDHPVVVSTFAFPSGHAANSMIVYLLLALLLVDNPRRRAVAVFAALVLTLLVGTSRVLLGVHWPSDVIGGWSFGLLWVLLTLELQRRWTGLNRR